MYISEFWMFFKVLNNCSVKNIGFWNLGSTAMTESKMKKKKNMSMEQIKQLEIKFS